MLFDWLRGDYRKLTIRWGPVGLVAQRDEQAGSINDMRGEDRGCWLFRVGRKLGFEIGLGFLRIVGSGR